MIKAENLTKVFDDCIALNGISCSIEEGCIYGMVGSNGAGKSTFLRLITGIYKADEGTVTIDGNNVFENAELKSQMAFVPDELYFLNHSSMDRMAKLYISLYDSFSVERYEHLKSIFKLNGNKNLNTFSKGMKRQAATILALSCRPKYLFLDETFDGLDPVMRQGIKSIFAKEMEEKGLTPVIASHNLRELEDICDHVGLLHKGGVLLSKDLEDMKCNIQKVQCVFATVEEELKALSGMEVLKKEQRGSLRTFTVRSTREEVAARFATVDTVFYEVLPLSLEEIFISETEVVGYDIKKLILG